MRESPQRSRIYYPEIVLSELLRNYAKGAIPDIDDGFSIIKRALVVAVDTVGSRLQNENGEGHVSHTINGVKKTYNAMFGPRNPKNSIKARLITNDDDQFFDDNSLRIFWPFLSEHTSIPIKPGEHVYVLFEDEHFEHGLWIAKIAGHSNVNFYDGKKSYTLQENRLMNSFSDTKSTSKEDASSFVGEHRASNRKARSAFGL